MRILRLHECEPLLSPLQCSCAIFFRASFLCLSSALTCTLFLPILLHYSNHPTATMGRCHHHGEVRTQRAFVRPVMVRDRHLDAARRTPIVLTPLCPGSVCLREPHASARCGCKVLELGCGTGVPGMCLRIAGGKVTLTEQPQLVPLLVNNLNTNFTGDADISAHELSVRAPNMPPNARPRVACHV